MNLAHLAASSFPTVTTIWLVLLAAVVVAGLAGLLFLLRELGLSDAHAIELEREIERLHDRIFELADSEERLRDLAKVPGDYVVRRDKHGRIIFANDDFARLAGRARDELIGSRHDLAVTQSQFVRVCENGTRLIDEAVACDRGLRWILLARGDDPDAERPRCPARRPRRHRPHLERASARRGAGQGRGGKRGEVSISCNRQS